MNQEGIYRKIQSLGETDYAVRKLATKFYWVWWNSGKDPYHRNIAIPMKRFKIRDHRIGMELLKCGVRYINYLDTMYLSEEKIRHKVRKEKQRRGDKQDTIIIQMI